MTKANPQGGELWYEDDVRTRDTINRRVLTVTEVRGDTVSLYNPKTRKVTKASITRFGKSGGYKPQPL